MKARRARGIGRDGTPVGSLRVCFIGPALGSHPGWVTTQGEVLASLFRDSGQPVRITSTQINRIQRAADTVSCLVRWRHQIDVAVISVFSGAAFWNAEAASRTTAALGIPTVFWLHGGNLPTLFAEHRARAVGLLRRGAAIVSPSGYLARAGREIGFDPLVIPNVVDLSDCHYRARTQLSPRMLWMRTFEPLYNPMLAVHAMSAIIEKVPGATLTMAGQNRGLVDDVRREVRNRGLTDVVTFPGFLDATAKPKVFERHDVFLNTNRVDNTPVGVLEAAAFGLPIVSTSVGGIPDLLEQDKTGLLVPSNDPDAMAHAVCRVLDDPQLAGRLSSNGRHLAEKSDWPRVRDAWLELFERVANPA